MNLTLEQIMTTNGLWRPEHLKVKKVSDGRPSSVSVEMLGEPSPLKIAIACAIKSMENMSKLTGNKVNVTLDDHRPVRCRATGRFLTKPRYKIWSRWGVLTVVGFF